MDNPSELSPSELGTIEYWQSNYEREKQNFKAYGDPGEIWFGEDSQNRILKWFEKSKIPKDKSIVDVGCGNGLMLIEMRNEGFLNLTGIDYCSEAIDLAKSLSNSQSIDDIKFEVVDITDGNYPSKFDIALDKGTYDAICLNPDHALDKRKKYIQNVAQILNEDGLFVLTSCNWTEDEVGEHFKEEFESIEVIPTPTFRFGGKVGSVVTSLVFKKRSR